MCECTGKGCWEVTSSKNTKMCFLGPNEIAARFKEAHKNWVDANKTGITGAEFIGVLLDHYTQDYTGQAQRLAADADKCTGCTEPDCLVMLDDTCERGRKMGEKPSPNPEF